MADTIEIIQGTATTIEVAGLQGPQGPAGATGSNGAAGQGVPVGGTTGQVLRKVSGTNYDTEWAGAASGSGSVTSVALAGTGLSITGSPITTSGTLTANVSYGTTAGTACEGNDSRIANISNGTGSIPLGQSGTRTTLNGAASGSNKTISLPNATGILALTQQATDYEVTDETKGVIMKSANGTRWRVTIDNNGSLLRTALATLILSALMLCGAQAQVRDLVFGTNNVVVGPTNGVALLFTNSVSFSNSITFGTNAAIIRTNLGGTTVGNSVFTATNAEAAANAIGLGETSNVTFNNITIADQTLTLSHGSEDDVSVRNESGNLELEAQVQITAYSPISFNNTTNAATTRTNLGLGALATNNSVPSGAATTNSLLRADGAGGSAFVATLPSLTIGVGTNTDITLQRETNNALSQRNGTNPQTLFLFNTYSNSTNYERGFLKWNTNVFQIGTEKGSAGGTARGLEFQTDATTRFTISSAGLIGLGSSSSSSGLGASGLYVNTGAAQISMGSYLSSVQAYNQRVEIYGDNAAGTATVLMLSCGKDLVRFGGTTTNFPSLKRTNTVLQVRLADDSAFTTIDAQLRAQGTAPTNSTATGTAGDIRYDTNNFLYICVSSNTWRRTALTNW